MKITAISDLHGFLPDIPECDVLCIAGDICPAWNHTHRFQMRWLDRDFRVWLEKVPAKHIIGIAGNHDLIFEKAYHSKNFKLPELPWTYLCDSGTEIGGVKFYGTPWQVPFYDWAFNRKEEVMDNMFFCKIPEGLDILISHCPPKGYNDVCSSGMDITGEHLGSWALLKHIQRAKPKWNFLGHIHTGSHVPSQIEHFDGSITNVVNVSYINEQYDPAYSPFELDL